jgi:hypothetical protein
MPITLWPCPSIYKPSKPDSNRETILWAGLAIQTFVFVLSKTHIEWAANFSCIFPFCSDEEHPHRMSKDSNEANNFITSYLAQIQCKIKRHAYLVHFSCGKNTISEQDGLNHG